MTTDAPDAAASWPEPCPVCSGNGCADCEPDDAHARAQAAAAARVTAGAAAFDAVCPDWFNRINIDSLDVADSYHCPAAQLYPLIDIADEAAYDRAARWAGCDPSPFMISVAALAGDDGEEWAAAHGCDADWDAERGVHVGTDALTLAWRAEIRRRRAAVTS